jgi:hypothetical protein
LRDVRVSSLRPSGRMLRRVGIQCCSYFHRPRLSAFFEPVPHLIARQKTFR